MRRNRSRMFDSLEPRLLLAATKVVFTSSPVSLAAGSVASTLTLQLQDGSGVAQNAGGGGQVVNLSTSSNTGGFLDLSNGAISNVTIPAGSSSATFQYQDFIAGAPTLIASSAGLAGAVQQETVTATAATQLAFTTLPSGTPTNSNSTTITITLRDANGNVTTTPGALTLNLSSNSAGGTFSTGATTNINAGASSASFTYKDTIVGTPTITVTASGVTQTTQQQTIYNATTTIVKPDPAGLGSYGSTPPGGANGSIVYGTQYDWINRPAGSSLPTNDWWTLILKSGFAGSLYSMPQKLFTQGSGITVSGFTGTNSINNNIGYSGEQTVSLGGNGVNFSRDALVNYSDWMVQFRMEQSANQYVDVTAVQGSPMAWYEFNNVSPTFTVGTAGTYGTIFDGGGASLGNGSASFTTDHFRFTKTGVNFAVFAPANTTFVPTAGGGFNVGFAGADHYLVVATMPDATSGTFADFYNHAYGVPRSTAYNFSYDPAAGSMSTTWDITTQALKGGASTDIIQGWLPVNYRDIKSGPATVSGYTWPTIYGTVKASEGHSFTIVQPTTGLNFVLPAPQAIGGTSDWDLAKMHGWLNTYQLGAGTDSYGGETTLSQAAEMTLFAKQLNDSNYNRLLGILNGAVTNWLTYANGDNRYFTYYPKDHAMIAYPTAFGSEHYTDIHFHYGYLTSSAAVLAMLDPTWAANYGAMATLVAKSYANWDRNDTTEPYLRTFNPWKGHSYADGLGDSLGNQGNDQESVSEAVQSWQGLVLLGAALQNQQMLDAGMMGYVMESKSETEYWLNVAHKDLNPAAYPANRNTAINADFTREQQTFFGNLPKYQLGIVGLPDWPSMDFLGKYNQNMQDEIDATLTAIGGADPWQTLGSSDDGNNWLATILGIQGQVNPQKAADQFARLSTLNAADNSNALSGIPYYLSQSNRTYGLRDFAYHLSVPVGGVYTSLTGAKTYVVFNSANSAQTIQVLDASNNVVDSFSAPARQITIIQPFATLASGVLTVKGTPNVDGFTLSQSGSTVTVTLGAQTANYDISTIGSIIVNGLASDDTLDFNSTIGAPVTFNGGTGNDTLNVNGGTSTFTADANVGTSSLTVNVAGGASVLFNSSQHLAGLTVNGSAVLSAGGGKLLVTKALSIPSGTLDLNDNDMIVDYTSGSPLGAIGDAIRTARNSGTWLGAGLTSTAAKTNGAHNTTLGAIEASDYESLSVSNTTFDNEPIDNTAVLVKYTYYGDANFNGKVDGGDYARIDSAFNQEHTAGNIGGWFNGDFDYNGKVDGGDYALIDSAFNSQSGVLRPTVPSNRPRGSVISLR